MSASQCETCLEEIGRVGTEHDPSVHSQLTSALGWDTTVCMPLVLYPHRVTAVG